MLRIAWVDHAGDQPAGRVAHIDLSIDYEGKKVEAEVVLEDKG